MEFVVLGAVIVAIAAWVAYLVRRQSTWRGRLAQAIPVHSSFWRERRKAEGERLYVALGDSAAQGIGASRPDHSYVGVLARQLGDGWRVVNLGISGATVRMVLDSELPAFRKLQPDLVTVSIGANDIAGFDEQRFARDIRALFDALPDHAIVATVPSFHFLPAEKRVRAANRIITDAAAERGLAVAPLHARTRRQGLWGVSTQFAGDLFHPNDRGYRVWASAFEPLVDSRVREL
ncbi:MAG: SGNH/GDSL hydrolase family protein [Actinobacteria bacterium]|nr:SGNH/GDSL hydrolase family protein [Actinomycetota bacterium]